MAKAGVMILVAVFAVLQLTEAIVGVPEVCDKPIEHGLCMAYMPRYAYSKKEGTCVEFIYGGCSGNSNNFMTMEGCMRTCMAPLKAKRQSVDRCEQPLDSGPCMAYFPMYGMEDGVCKEFVYGGCKGNDNRFETKAECERVCSA